MEQTLLDVCLTQEERERVSPISPRSVVTKANPINCIQHESQGMLNSIQ